MSIVEKLSILGIRSFGSEHNDKQSIIFKPPVTLILGANGCGKTTIIECLKYAITGEVPPGTNKGQSFVHDPKLSKSIESLGQVKLRVRTLKGHQLTVSRAMKTFIKNNVLRFSAFDSSMTLTGKNGREEQLTNRCLDVSNEMCQAMGVSKAILNNVIFCHQEDSNWPLDEPKKLKEKFDAIFGTTEYNKAIDRITKMRKPYTEKQREKDSEIKVLLRYRKETESKQLDLGGAQNKLKKIHDEIETYEVKLIPIQARLAEIQKIEYDLGAQQSRKVEVSTKLKNCQDQQTTLKRKINNVFDGSLFSLDEEIRNFKSSMSNKNDILESLLLELQMSQNKEKKISLQLTDSEAKRTSFSYLRQQEQEQLSERADTLKNICRRLGISLEEEFDSCSDIIGIVSQIDDSIQAEGRKITTLIRSHDEIENGLQKQIDSVKGEKIEIESNTKSKNQQIIGLQKEKEKLTSEIDRIERSAQQLKILQENIEKSNKNLEAFMQRVNLTEMKSLIATRKAKREELQLSLDQIDKKLTDMNKISKLLSQISLKEDQVNQRTMEVARIKQKHNENIKILLKNNAAELKNLSRYYRRYFEQLMKTIQRNLNAEDQNLKKNEKNLTEFKMIRKNQRDELKKLEKELNDSEEAIYELCGTTPFDETVLKLKEEIDKIRFEYGALESSNVLYKKYIEQVDCDPHCPLCHRSMNSNESSKLSSELQDEIQQLPEKIELTKERLDAKQTDYEKLLKNQPVSDKIDVLRTSIKQLKEKLRETEENLKETEKQNDSIQKSKKEPISHLEIVNSLIGDMSILDEAIKDVANFGTEVTRLKSQLPQNYNQESSIDDIELEKSVISGELKAERLELDTLEKKYESSVNELNTARDSLSKLKEKQIQLQEGVQALSQLKSRVEEISKQITAHNKDITELNKKLQPLTSKIKSEETNKEKIQAQNRRVLSEEQAKVNTIKMLDQQIKKISQKIDISAELNLASQIEIYGTKIKKFQDEKEALLREIENITKKIATLRDEIALQIVSERNLQDNHELKKLEMSEKDLQNKLDVLQKEIGDADYRTISKEKGKLIESQEKFTKEKSKLTGQTYELENQVENFQKFLRQDEYKNSLLNYRCACHELEALKAIQHDLKEYQVALEWALIKFHSEKMAKINQIIREYWRSIYRGNDIDFIEIKTDETGTDSDKKRNYNYRVVQTKNDVELDMRGRCSAGQRVLACLIIRIALAETFSANCGVLALDEPTTNLDRSNIISLCDVLKRVIEERQSQANFMFIIITHDEEFVSALDHIENFYKLYRNNAGKSAIELVDQH